MIFAHTGGDLSGLLSGIAHPLTGPDHLVVMVAVGVTAAMKGRRGGRAAWILVSFLGALVTGSVFGMAGAAPAGVETAIVASVILVPVAVMSSARRVAPVAVLAAGAGLAHGAAHGLEAPVSSEAAFLMGIAIATVVLNVAGVGLAARIGTSRSGQVALGAASLVAGAVVLGAA